MEEMNELYELKIQNDKANVIECALHKGYARLKSVLFAWAKTSKVPKGMKNVVKEICAKTAENEPENCEIRERNRNLSPSKKIVDNIYWIHSTATFISSCVCVGTVALHSWSKNVFVNSRFSQPPATMTTIVLFVLAFLQLVHVTSSPGLCRSLSQLYVRVSRMQIFGQWPIVAYKGHGTSTGTMAATVVLQTSRDIVLTGQTCLPMRTFQRFRLCMHRQKCYERLYAKSRPCPQKNSPFFCIYDFTCQDHDIICSGAAFALWNFRNGFSVWSKHMQMRRGATRLVSEVSLPRLLCVVQVTKPTLTQTKRQIKTKQKRQKQNHK